MSEAFLKLVNMSISAGWLVLAVLALRLILKKAPKWVNVLLWGIVALRLICPFSIESALSLIPSQETISPEIMMDWTPEISTGIEPLDQVVNPVISTSFAPEPSASANPLQILIPVAANIWLLGVLAMLVYTAVSYISLRRKLRTAVILRNSIFQCETVQSPFVLGVFRPRIYLPYAIEGQNLYHVVAHEQAHIRRKDHWWKPLGFLLLTVYWFNPLMWIAYVLLCRDIELACDEKVIAQLGNDQRADYTQALVACSVNRRVIAACPLAFGEVGVKERVKSVMNYKKPAFWMVIMAVVVCVVVAVCFLTNPIDNTNNESFLNYKNAISMSQRQDVIPAIHYSSENDQASIGIGMVEGIAFSEYLDNAQWNEKRFAPSDLSSPGSVAVNVAENLRITIYDRNFAAVEFNDEVCYYRTANDDYEKLLDMLMPADEERLENSAETRLELALGVATIGENADSISFGVYDLEGENAGITEIYLRNLHNGEETIITDESSMRSIYEFLSKVQGVNAASSMGYYGGCYEVQMRNGTETVFGIGFGDDESFNHGVYGDGYPVRYDLRGVSREDVLWFFSQYDSSDFDWGLDESVSTYESYNVVPLEELPDTYTLEEATIDKCVMVFDGEIRDNADVWQEFRVQTSKGHSATVRIVHYYHGTDSSPAVKFIFDLTYDGKIYELRWLEEGKEYIEQYQYLRYFDGLAENENAEYDAYKSYILTNDTKATRQELLLSYASSTYGAAIPHFEVFADYIVYPDYPAIPSELVKAEFYNAQQFLYAYQEEKMLSRLQNLLANAQGLGFEPKTYDVYCNLVLTGTDGSIVTLGLDAMHDLFVIDGAFFDYGPGYDDNGNLNATQELLTLLGLQEWPK